MLERWIVDTLPSERYPIFTRANVGEVFPDPVTPLSATQGIQQAAEPGWRDAWARFGAFDHDEFSPEPEIIGTFGGYCYLNVTAARIFGVRTPGISPEVIDQTFFGEQPGVPPYAPQPSDESPEHTARIEQTLGWILTVDELTELREEQTMLEALRRSRPDLAALTDAELVARDRALMTTHFRRLFGQHIFHTYAATVPVGILQAVTAAVGRPEVFMELIAGVGDVESAQPSMAMWAMGRRIAASPSLRAAFDDGVAGVDTRLRDLAAGGDADARELLADFERFVEAYGCRGPNEWEARSPTWETEPELAWAAIDRMRVSSEAQAPADAQARRSATRLRLGTEIAAMLVDDPDTQGQFVAALASATRFLAGRERSKTNAVKLVHEVRLTLNELGRRMVERGVFDEVGNYAMLRADELESFVADPGSFRDELLRREADYAMLCELEPPFVFEGDPPPVSTWDRRGDRLIDLTAAGGALQGLPGCSGTARGRARVILDSHDPFALEPGDILVAPLTDPSWTPLFVPAAAVVVDVGAALSHAIIVSRELGIPCVVSVTDGTRRIPDGAMIEVNGDTGVVTVLSA